MTGRSFDYASPNTSRGQRKQQILRLSWMVFASMAIFLVYGIRMTTLMVSVHHSMYPSIGRVVVPSKMHSEKSVDNFDKSEEEEDATTCWTVPKEQEIQTFEISPKNFMDEGLGKDFLELYKNQLSVQEQKGKRPVLRVRFVVYYLLQTCQPVYYHIHKNGGTTMNIQDNPVVNPYYTPKEQQIGRLAFRNATEDILRNIYKSQKQQSSLSAIATSNHVEMPFFTFLRDPVPRFISGIGQAIKLNKLGPCLTNAENKATNLLECILDQINTTKYFIDEHLVPQSFELYHGLQGIDLKLQVMDMSSIERVLQNLGFGLAGAIDNSKKRRSMTMNARRYSGIINGLRNPSKLPQSLILRICEIYRVDVLLLQMCGVTKSICPTLLIPVPS